MKNIVVLDEYNEIDLKPSALFDKYLALVEKDVAQLTKGSLKDAACPGCGRTETVSTFAKFGLKYNECAGCRSLYISPRPDDATLNKFFTQSPSRIFWNQEYYGSTKRKRQEKIIKPRFQWIIDSTQEYSPKAQHFVDINANQFGYSDELAQAKDFAKKTLVDPLVPVTSTYEVEILKTPWWQLSWQKEVDVVSLFEVVDRTSDVEALFKKLNQILKKGGLCFMTSILASGFDVQVLWEKAKNIFPPDRLNVLTVEGIKALAARHGFECLEFSTPGIFDLETVEKAYRSNPEIQLPRFVEYLINSRSEEYKKSFQNCLQANLLSSYGRILIQKK